ncbi:Phosphoglycerate mutase [Beijerinckiaceae bacterium RH AL1]|nr:Phosphoglycerate mutase [Beijerinckiaceae bacterium RH CH11]VVB48761.1 Phosphoglycerate mutase [Beijerinckiaceae bacterium RH AL8]VVC56514.1 Phosphoglycerate mutase [Beijerinckiaceae bacterium RH AL1]
MLLRHAKAVQQSRGDDFARDLQDKGRRDAALLGAYLRGHDLVPDVALVSASARTRQTFDGLRATIEAPVAARYDDDLYNATAGEIRTMLRATQPGVRSLMVVGHNPGIADLAVMLARDGDLAEIGRMRARFAPCSLAVITCNVEEWADVAATGGRLDLFLQPEDLG